MALSYTFKQTSGSPTPSSESATGEQSSRPVKVPCGTIWPNGEFGLGYSPSKELSTPLDDNLAGGVSSGHMREVCQDVAEGGAALDLTSLPNSHTPTNRPETYGRKGLTGRGGKMVRNGAYCLQRDHRKGNLTFLTLTLPAMSQQSARLVGESWGESVRQLLQWITRRLKGKGLPAKVVCVTELQSQRLESGDSACLHLHAVFVGRKPGKAWVITPKEVRQWWTQRLTRVTDTEVYSPSCCDMKPVRKDAGNYLSKYMSKGSDGIEKLAAIAGWDAVPRQWWNVTSDLRGQVKRECMRSEGAMMLLDCLVSAYWDGDADGVFKFVRCIEVAATDYQSFVVGFWGKLNPGAREDIREMVSDYVAAI